MLLVGFITGILALFTMCVMACVTKSDFNEEMSIYIIPTVISFFAAIYISRATGWLMNPGWSMNPDSLGPIHYRDDNNFDCGVLFIIMIVILIGFGVVNSRDLYAEKKSFEFRKKLRNY